MGMIGNLLSVIFGNGRNAIKETVEVFRPNAEAADQRGTEHYNAAMAQLAAEFARPRAGLFDRVIDGVNRLPRPIMVLGVIALFCSAMTDPIWFAERMQGLNLVPEPLWWLLGVVVSFYFGARHQTATQNFQRSIATSLSRAPDVVRNIRGLQELRDPQPDDPGLADPGGDAAVQVDVIEPAKNPALDEWRGSRRGDR